jgi:hypothetical protein
MSEQLASASAWATEEFGHAQLGNQLRTRRLVKIAHRLADSPAGMVSEVHQSDAERVGAYRFVENPHVSHEALVRASAEATLRRCEGESWTFAPIDGSSLSFSDPRGRRGLGAVGPYAQKGRGIKTMTSIAVRHDGSVLGLLDLQYWSRKIRKRRKPPRPWRSIESKETRFWLQAIQRITTVAENIGARTRLWFQLDREGDFYEMLCAMAELEHARVTVRAAQNRRTADPDCALLWDSLTAQPCSAAFGLSVPAGPKRQARKAKMVIRHAPIELLLRHRSRNYRDPRTRIALWAVLVLEEDSVPPGQKPLQWLLLTNAPIHDASDAAEVVHGYSLRWRVEDFHRCWKTNCRVESIQLHQVPHIQRWATLLAAVAIRIERLKHLARNEPDAPASIELSQDEIDAVIVLRQPPDHQPGDCPPISQVVRWIADIGGYIGPSNGPPGSTVISRGLQRVEVAQVTLRNLSDFKPD